MVVGAGAAGLMAAIQTARTLTETDARVVLLDGAKTVGVKILVAGGGRCNVTHHEVDEQQYAGGSRNTIRTVLRQFGVAQTVQFFRDLGVELKREDTGKLFPVTDSARSVLDALLTEVRRLNIDLRHPWRVDSIERQADASFRITNALTGTELDTRCVILATGGKALPKSGSDGSGYTLARQLGHTLTTHQFPALVPLIIGSKSHWLTELSGISARAAVEVRSGRGKRLARFENDLLCTHFGLSGPAIMDASRWLTHARFNDPDASLYIGWVIGESFASIDDQLAHLGRERVSTWLRGHLPERLARSLCQSLNIDPAKSGAQLSKPDRRALAHGLVEMPVEIAGDRGFTHAEVTAGGVPLDEIDPKTMKSRRCDNLWLVGEILDVDGRIGGFNFQWAWATGAIAGRSIAGEVIAQKKPGS